MAGLKHSTDATRSERRHQQTVTSHQNMIAAMREGNNLQRRKLELDEEVAKSTKNKELQFSYHAASSSIPYWYAEVNKIEDLLDDPDLTEEKRAKYKRRLKIAEEELRQKRVATKKAYNNLTADDTQADDSDDAL